MMGQFPNILFKITTLATMTMAIHAHAMLPNPTDQNNQLIAGAVPNTATAQAPQAQPAQTNTPVTTQSMQLPVQSQVPTLQMPANTQTVTANVNGNQLSANIANVGQMSLSSNHQDVSSGVYAYVVEGANLVPVTQNTQLKSGDVVEYQGYFNNTSNDRIRTMTVMMSIPDGMEFVGQQSPQFAFASMDGSHFVRMPLRANMNGVVQELPLSYYKALRWDIEDVGLQGTAVVKYRARVK